MRYFDLRMYKSGWRISFGPLYIFRNRQEAYREFIFGRVRSAEFQQIGGMSFREWKLAKQQQEEAKASARIEAEANG